MLINSTFMTRTTSSWFLRFIVSGYIMLISFACNDKPVSKQDVVLDSTNSSAEMKKPETTTSSKKNIMFFGDSLTAGYGLDEEESYPSLIQNRIDSLGLSYQVINAGLSGETTTGGLGRIDWVLQQPIDVFVLALGSNDMLRGLDLSLSKDNLRKILDKVREHSPSAKIILAGMLSPPNMGEDYSRGFNGMFGEIAKDYNASLIPFLLEGVAGDPSLNLADGKHPNAIGQTIVVENVWQILKEVL